MGWGVGTSVSEEREPTAFVWLGSPMLQEHNHLAYGPLLGSGDRMYPRRMHSGLLKPSVIG